MQRTFLRRATIAVVFLGGISFAAAQNTAQPEPANPPPAAPNQTKKDTVPPATDKSEETRAGTTEPSSKVKSTTDTSVFVNGVLAVPGAPTDVDTAPAKFSARTAADDALPIAGYVLRHLTDEQRSAIFQRVRAKQVTKATAGLTDSAIIVGSLVPAAAALEGLSPLPEDVIAKLPEMRTVMFTTAGEKVLLINPTTRLVIGVLNPE
jgi:hypothetical protein